MNISNKLSQSSVAIVSHVYATGPSHSLEDYIKDKVKKLIFIGHPFVFAKDPRSHIRTYTNKNAQKQELFSSLIVSNQILSIVKDFFLTLWWLFPQGKIDLYVGVDGTNAFVGILLKKIGRVNTVVFYTIDYVPDRFPSKILNGFYHFFDTFAVKHADKVWNLSDIMVKEREKKGISVEYRKKQIVVPVGTEIAVKPKPLSKIKRYSVAHMGHLIEKQGVQLFIQSIPDIVKQIPKFHAEIIGGGEYEATLKGLAKDLNVAKYITFHGFIKDHTEVEELLSRCACAIAPYIDSKENYVRYTDPGKVKAYLAVGLPIVITKVPSIADLIHKKKTGFAVKDRPEEVSQAVVNLLKDDKLLEQYRQNAAQMAEEYRWDNIFDKALSSSL